ncbi:CRISPR-associated ring nuclease Crn3/Csx3 [Methylacidimicrobium tartarophylax]|uniref:CRISPR-associated protein Csx3 n=1 Tax=Methylacidimicrobium tartarophylax TaxID=1041768 RepID=A0A5E6MH26_9BACT|nr:CRISPR-associated ring nuclease Crn3/Csx3 [Methylacidimicrobium tartarophylax]VVM05374.1 hypothetical protein MAMT_00626 [Methylacidimicrobium tartarophylax]
MKNLSLRLVSPPHPFQILAIHLTGNGILDAKELPGISLPEEIDYQKGLILFGKGPIWLYTYLAHLAHPCRWLAVYDPRCGGIVVEAHHPDAPSVGEILSRESIDPHLPRREVGPPAASHPPEAPIHRVVAVVGPPHSGKSVFLFWLREALRRRVSPERFQNDLFTIRACPDGEGDWFFEAPGAGETLRYKNHWDAEFVAKSVEQIQNLSRTKVLLLVDCGGKIDRFNRDILSVCTDVLIVSGDAEAFAEWRGAAQVCGLQRLAEVQSVLEPTRQVLSHSPFRIRVGRLDRGAAPSELPPELVDKLLDCFRPLGESRASL